MTRRFAENELVIATHNRGKMEEFRDLFAVVPLPRPRGGGMGSSPAAQLHLRPRNMPSAPAGQGQARTWGERIRFLSCADFALPAPEETGATFLENATIKALHAAQATERVAMADDSGFCVDALDGAPGVYSADWAETPHGRDFNAAMQKVHKALAGNENNRASFVCCLALAWPDGHIEAAEGRIAGRTVWPPRGDKGFGYDPIFIPGGYDVTYAELSREEKNKNSHRAMAFKAMMDKCF